MRTLAICDAEHACNSAFCPLIVGLHAETRDRSAYGAVLLSGENPCTASLVGVVVPPRLALFCGIFYLDVDEMARAKGQDYVTLVYRLTLGENCGRIQWVRAGREAPTLREFFNALSMQMLSAAISDCRQEQFNVLMKTDDLTGQQTIKRRLWLLQFSRKALKESNQIRLNAWLPAENLPLTTICSEKERFQYLWYQPASSAEMAAHLDGWCVLASITKSSGLAKFVRTLQSHCSGIWVYADHQIKTIHLKAGNVSIDLLLCRGRGFDHIAYLKLQNSQRFPPDTSSLLFANVPLPVSEGRMFIV